MHGNTPHRLLCCCGSADEVGDSTTLVSCVGKIDQSMSRVASHDVVVIGAGVGGLSVAVRLAAQGHSVTICEQSSEVGGKLGLFERDGFRFDTGPSLLTLPSIWIDTLVSSGMTTEEAHTALSLRRLDPIARYRFADGTWWDHPAAEDAFVDACETLSSGSSTAMIDLLRRAEAMWNVSKGPFLESPLRGARSLLTQARRLQDLRTIAPHRTLHSIASDAFADPRLVQFVDRYATYSGSDPRRSPAVLASILWAERSEGAWYVDGGLRRIAEVLLKRCEQLGVSIRTSTDVERLMVNERQATGVRLTDGEQLRADVVVCNADAAHLYRDLVESDVGSAGLRSVERSEPSLSGFVMCLAVDRTLPTANTLPTLAHHNVLFPTIYAGEFDDLFSRPPRVVNDPAIYLSIPDDPEVAPPGCEAWFVLVNAPRHDPDNVTGVDWTQPGFADREADRLLAKLAQRGVDVRPFVRFRELRTPADLSYRTRADGGSIYGTSSNGVGAAFLRPANQSPIPGLYLVGGSSHPGGGLPLVQLSAKIVSELINH
jgi:phytoene desaturase